MDRSFRPSRMPSKLSESLQRKLNAYALAASAAGVGMLALVQPAEARIIYTKTHKVIGLHGLHTYSFDLNHDGINDFTIAWRKLSQTYRVLLEVGGIASGSKQVLGAGYAQAVPAGSSIGPKRRFWSGFLMIEGKGSKKSDYTSFSGGWVNSHQVENGYLGLRFFIKGKLHYGWARCTVRTRSTGVTAIVHGFAYETIPNKPIIAGKTHGEDDIERTASASLTSPTPTPTPTPKPAMLGLLAMGTPALSIWRRREWALHGN
jgi:hypothetical protein